MLAGIAAGRIATVLKFDVVGVSCMIVLAIYLGLAIIPVLFTTGLATVMIVYEVRASVEAGIAADYRAWLEPHIREILGIRGFARAELLGEDSDDGRVIFTVRYHLDTRAALELYLRDHAPRLRADASARFGERFAATRRVSELVQVFDR